MSWSLGLMVNTVKISSECAKELFEAQDEDGEGVWSSLEDVTRHGTLNFNPDHMEGMDYLGNNENLIKVLKRHKVKGEICFGSLEGDNARQFWGYRFDGNGGMSTLAGQVVYEARCAPFAGMTFVVTGTITGMTRRAAHEKIKELGGEVSDTVSQEVTHLVCGGKPGSKLARAKKVGINIWTEKQFLEVIGQSVNTVTQMDAAEKEKVAETIENEGFDYAFVSYGDFKDIKDKKFHELRKAYVKARKNLADYIGDEN